LPDIDAENDAQIRVCADTLRAGGVIAYPTEGVWGLGCDPLNEKAVGYILDIKQRPMSKGLILASGNIEHFKAFLVGLDQSILETMRASWPGPTTWLVPHNGLIPQCIHGDSDKVAIRVSGHKIVAALSEKFGAAIVSTSANPSTLPAAKTAAEARGYFQHHDVTFAPGETGGREGASTIIDALTGNVIRA